MPLYRACLYHCDRYVPQHAHNAACLQLALDYEQQQRFQYDYFVKARPDLSFSKPLPTISVLNRRLRTTGSSSICLSGQSDGQLAGGKPVDDKFALMPRDVALVYLNATVRCSRAHC